MVMKIGGAISEGLGLEDGLIEECLGEGVQILAANYYPPCPEPEKTLGLAAHSDHGALTILTQNGVDGLQIKHDQTWLAVHHLPGSFLVNIGDYFEVSVYTSVTPWAELMCPPLMWQAFSGGHVNSCSRWVGEQYF